MMRKRNAAVMTGCWVVGILGFFSSCGLDDGPEQVASPIFHVKESGGTIGEPCMFRWPKNADYEIDYSAYPICHPLQDDQDPEVSVNNEACPMDCIQLATLECENLICVATQIGADRDHMNGQCWESLEASAPKVSCMGYCSKDCLTDQNCPIGYRCVPIAPFTGLRCDSSDWEANCTDFCTDSGEEGCPTMQDQENCDIDSTLGNCCVCICRKYCPLVDKKYCVKDSWDKALFPGAETDANNC